MDIDINLANLSRDELEDECLHLQQKCKQLCSASEADAQRIHELKRSLETALAAETYLAQELEQLTVNVQHKSVDAKLQTDHEDLRRKYHELSQEFSALQDNYNDLSAENSKLHSYLQSSNDQKEKSCNSSLQASSEKLVDRLNELELENIELLQKIDKQQEDKMQQTLVLADKEKKIEMMQDEISCLEENLRYKREELEEKSRMLESAQEQLLEANCKINMLMSAPDNKDRKGNSLFAEVDDQRQAMKKLLAAQKKSFLEMKKIYNESQHEIRRLKRENAAMHTELQACSLIFCNADRTYQDKLNSRIKHLLDQNEELENNLKWMQNHIKHLANEKGQLWMDSMLNFCKKETEDLKTQMYSLLIKNASLEEQLRDTKQDMVRWRFEALKSRCLLINRENLLCDNKIEFKPQSDVEFNITEAQEKVAHPRIVPAVTPNVSSNISSSPCVDKEMKENAINPSEIKSTKVRHSTDIDPQELESHKENVSSKQTSPAMLESHKGNVLNEKTSPAMLESHKENVSSEKMSPAMLESHKENVSSEKMSPAMLKSHKENVSSKKTSPAMLEIHKENVLSEKTSPAMLESHKENVSSEKMSPAMLKSHKENVSSEKTSPAMLESHKENVLSEKTSPAMLKSQKENVSSKKMSPAMLESHKENISSKKMSPAMLESHKENVSSEKMSPATKREVSPTKILRQIDDQSENKIVETQMSSEITAISNNLPSILSKKRETFGLNAEKNVKFATNEATVFDISTNADSFVEEKGNATTDNNAKTSRSKSNIKVRRFVIGSKPK